MPAPASRKRRSLAVSTVFATGLLAALVLTSVVSAANPALPVRIVYSAAGTCGDATEFREVVRKKAPELVDARADEPAREFVVEARVRPHGTAEGNVVISEPSGAAITRRLQGDDCGEVIEALAFIVAELGRAVHLEPEGDATAPPPPIASTNPAPKPEARTEPSAERPELVRRARWRWEAGAGVQAVAGPAPDWLTAPLAYLELGLAPDGGSTLVSGRVSALYATSGTLRGTVGDAEIVWAVGRLEGCGPRFGSVLAASGCVSFDAGVLEGRGRRASGAKTERAVWLSPGLTLRSHFVIERTLAVGLEAGGFVAQIRPRFYFGAPLGEREIVHEVPWFGFRAGIALGVLFP